MRVIFLDIDGVLNSKKWFEIMLARLAVTGEQHKFDNGLVDPAAIATFNALLKLTHAKVVVSSTWRKYYPLDELKAHLGSQGLDTTNFIGKTGNSADGHRGREIAAWLEANDVDSFVAIDDSSDLENLGDRHFKTSWEEGLLPKHVDSIVALFDPSATDML